MWFLEEYEYRTATEEEVLPGGQGCISDASWETLCDLADEKRLREAGWVRVAPGFPSQQAAYQEAERRYAAVAATYTAQARQWSAYHRVELDPANLMCRTVRLAYRRFGFNDPEKLVREQRWRVRT